MIVESSSTFRPAEEKYEGEKKNNGEMDVVTEDLSLCQRQTNHRARDPCSF